VIQNPKVKNILRLNITEIIPNIINGFLSLIMLYEACKAAISKAYFDLLNK
jgi:hypothetical protein